MQLICMLSGSIRYNLAMAFEVVSSNSDGNFEKDTVIKSFENENQFKIADYTN